MEETELEQIASRLHNRYSETGRHYEIVNAERVTLGWNLTIREIITSDDDEEQEAPNESN